LLEPRRSGPRGGWPATGQGSSTGRRQQEDESTAEPPGNSQP